MAILQDESMNNYLSLFPEEMIASILDAFVINRPMNGKVGGDGFWVHQTVQHLFIVVFDCMGHGHLASMMTRIYTQALEEVIVLNKEEEPGRILTELHELIRQRFEGKKNLQVGSGADVGILKIDTLVRKIEFSGAKMDLHLVQDGTLSVIKSGRLQIGEFFEYDHQYETREIQLKSNMKSNFYLSSDGFNDLLGGENGKKFGRKNVKELLEMIYPDAMINQKRKIQKHLTDWMGSFSPLDDMLIVGFSV